MESSIGALGGGAKLKTIDCVAQSLAVGPIFSAAAIGGALAGLAGGVGPIVIVLTTVGILGLGYLVSELAKRFGGSGTVYEYVANTLGKKAAVFGAGCYHLAAIALLAGLPIIGAIFLQAFCDAHLGFKPPLFLAGLVVLGIVVGINIVGVQLSVKSQLGIIVVSVIPFLVLAVAIIMDGGPEGNRLAVFDPGNAAEGGSLFKGLLFAILMFVGFELAAALGEETEDPKRSIPRAVMLTILIVSAFYILTQYVGTIGSGGPDALPFDFGILAEEYVGRWLAVLVELAVILDILAVGIGFCAATARGVYTIARDGLLPKPLTAVSSRNVPVVATVTVGVLSLAVLVAGLAQYGTGSPVDETGAVVGPPDLLNAFLVTSTIGAMVICIVYVLLCIGGIQFFARQNKVPAVVGGVVGLVTAGAGVAAQFIEGTAPVGDALWGRHLGIGLVVLVGAWLVASVVTRPEQVDLVGQHALQHAEV